MSMSISKFNQSNCLNMTAYTVLTHIERDERKAQLYSVAQHTGRQSKFALPAIHKKAYICSPYRGKTADEVNQNIRNAIRYCRAAVNNGYMPVAPHLFLTRFLDDYNPVERELGLLLGLEMLRDCSEIWVFGDTISEGMKSEIKAAHQLRITIKLMGVIE